MQKNGDLKTMEDSFFQNDELLIPNVDESTIDNENASKISELSKKGYQLLKDDDTDGARAAFNEILELDENNNYALVGLGDIERKLNHIDLAIANYEKCLEYFPANNYALFGLADCYKSMKKFNKAIDIWQQYLVHDDKNITVITRVADAYRKIKDFKRSKELYLSVLEIEKDNAYALIGLGHLNYDFRDYKEALYYWTRIYDLNKDDADIRVLTAIGNCHRKLKTFKDGVYYFEKALEKEPHNFYALFGLADCYRGMNQQFKSIEYWNKILELDPENKVILTRAGDAFRTTGNYDKAIDYYTKALNIDFDIYAAIGLALICKTQGKIDEAIERFENLIKEDPKNARLYLDLSDCYLQNKDKENAIKVLENCLQIDGRNSLVRNNLEKLKKA